MPKNRVLTSLLPCFKVKGQGQGRGQGHGSMSKFKVKCLAPSSRYWARLCLVQQSPKKILYQSRVFVCVWNNRADAVDRLLIFRKIEFIRSFSSIFNILCTEEVNSARRFASVTHHLL